MQSRRKAIDGRAFHLRADSFRIDGAAAIDRVNEAVHLHGPVLHARFRDRRSVGVKRIKRCDAPSLALWKGLTPARLLRGELQNAFEPSGIERRLFLAPELRDLAVAADELQTKGQRILASGGGKLVNKTFHHEAAAGVFHGAPPRARNARFGKHVLDAEVRRQVWNRSAGAELAKPRILRPFLAPLGRDRG